MALARAPFMLSGMFAFFVILAVLAVALVLLAAYDLSQKKHAILRNFPIVGHFRYLLEMIGPELRQYIVTDNDSERPFSRDQRRWVYASSKKENNYFGFGTDNDLEQEENYIIIKHSAFPRELPPPGSVDYDEHYRVPCAKVLGEWRGRKKPHRPQSIVDVSGMSYGSLGSAAVTAINEGCKLAGCLHNTGEGGLSPYHLQGADLILQLGTAYFGCRDADGRFSMDRLKETVAKYPQIRAIEVKLSQGAKPGLGGLLPKEKITPEISAIRGIPMDRDCHSPSGHSAFSNVDGMLDFIESIADETGLPVGIKSAVGETAFWRDLAKMSATTGRAPDFINIDGGEGGTGASPLVHTDHIALPFKLGFARVRKIFVEEGIAEHIVWGGSGRLGFPEQAVLALAMGCDWIHVAREAMLAIGCIQAQRCHTGHCPAGIATHNKWLMRGLDPTLKAARLANYIVTFRKDLRSVAASAGLGHPSEFTGEHVEILHPGFRCETLGSLLGSSRK